MTDDPPPPIPPRTRRPARARARRPASPSARSEWSSATSAPARSTPSARPSPATTRWRSSAANVFGVLSLIFWAMVIVVDPQICRDPDPRRQQGGGRKPRPARAHLPQDRRQGALERRHRPSGSARLRSVLRRFDGHPGDLRAGRGRGADGRRPAADAAGAAALGRDPRRPVRRPAERHRAASAAGSVRSSRSIWRRSACSGRSPSPGIRKWLLAVDPRHAIRFFAVQPWLAFLALGSVVLAVTGAEALYAEMGRFGRRPIRHGWFFFVMPALMLNYLGQGALILDDSGRRRQPLLQPRPERARASARPPHHPRRDHRHPGGDLGRLLGHPAGDPARLRAPPEDRPHRRAWRDLHSGGQLDPDGGGAGPRPHLPKLVRARLGLRRRRHRGDADRHLPARRLAVVAVDLEAVAAAAAARAVPGGRPRFLRRDPDQGARRRLVPPARRGRRLHPAHHLGQGPAV